VEVGSPEATQLLRFPAAAYDAEVNRALTDTAWETPDRTAARLLAGRVDRRSLSREGLSYSWASGRVRRGAFSICLMLEPGPYQVLVHLPWRAESAEEIARRGAKLLADRPVNWADVEWFGQQPGLGPPALAGPCWRRGGS
jgi:hypothetical protein